MKLELNREDLKRIIGKWAETRFLQAEKVESVDIAGYGSTITVTFEEPAAPAPES